MQNAEITSSKELDLSIEEHDLFGLRSDYFSFNPPSSFAPALRFVFAKTCLIFPKKGQG